MSDGRNVTLSEPAAEASLAPSLETLVNEVARWLGLRVAEVDAEYMFGEIDGSPASMTVLAARPLSLLLAFRVASADNCAGDKSSGLQRGRAEPAYLPEGIAALAAQGKAKVSIEDDYAWLTLYGLDGASAVEIRDLVKSFAAALKKAGLALRPSCAKCGAEEGAELFFHGSTCSRLCRSCVERLFLDRHSAQRRIEAARLSYAFLVPPALLVIAAGWTNLLDCRQALVVRRGRPRHSPGNQGRRRAKRGRPTTVNACYSSRVVSPAGLCVSVLAVSVCRGPGVLRPSALYFSSKRFSLCTTSGRSW